MTSVSWVWNSDKGSTEVAYWIRNVQDVLLAGVRSSESAALCCSPKAPQWSALCICCRRVYVLKRRGRACTTEPLWVQQQSL